ncbi:MAG: NAD-dependent deacylase [Sphingobacteriales bacterium]|nr:MAG: NAD-dependent deacylase [Sphingobacteriales bacterium]
MEKQHIVILTGAGISAESGISTFRGTDGLWENHKIEDVASIWGWNHNPELVLEFYNLRRKAAAMVNANAAHYALARLEEKFKVTVITQNVDDLHERGGSTHIIHLHGKLSEAKSSGNSDYVVDIGDKPIKMGDLCPMGTQLRPNIVWFGEMVPNIEIAQLITSDADLFIIIGTSMQVYPAASLIHFAPNHIPIYIIDPNIPYSVNISGLNKIEQPATVGVPALVDELMGKL